MAGERDRGAKPATYADLVALPDNLIGEIIDGELVASPRPAPPHAIAASIIGSEVAQGFHREPGDPRGPGGWWIIYEPELHLGEDVLVPDLAGWRREHLPEIPTTAYFEVAPDWACEVVSPSSAAFDRVKKFAIYAREKVAHYWLMDPLARTLEVFRLESGRWVGVAGFEGDVTVRAEPFEAVEIDLSRCWLRPR